MTATTKDTGEANLTLGDVDSDTIISIWVRVYSFIRGPDLKDGREVCKAFCREISLRFKRCTVSGDEGDEGLTTDDLHSLAKRCPNLKDLSIEYEYREDLEPLDFEGAYFPELEQLSVSCAPLRSLTFTQQNTPKLKRLHLSNTSASHFNLDLPELKSAHMEYTEVDDAENFGPSLSRCPKLESFTSYKLWGLHGGIHELHLPSCETLDLYRSDTLSGLKLWAPKLVDLNLRSCYSLDCVRIMDVPAEKDEPLSKICVNLIYANVDAASLRHLHTHPRVLEVITDDGEDDDDGVGVFPGDAPMPDFNALLQAQMAEALANGGHVDPEQMHQMMMMRLMQQMMMGGMMGMDDDEDDEGEDDYDDESDDDDDDEDDESDWETVDGDELDHQAGVDGAGTGEGTGGAGEGEGGVKSGPAGFKLEFLD